jgi:hypothetical protein
VSPKVARICRGSGNTYPRNQSIALYRGRKKTLPDDRPEGFRVSGFRPEMSAALPGAGKQFTIVERSRRDQIST